MVESTDKTQLRVFNSLTKQKDVFKPIDPNQVTWYTCGPTVYDDSHLGHARTYVSFDIIYRLMRDYFGYNVKLCMNITDLDDKIIRKSIDQQRDFMEIARHYESEFLEDMRRLNVALPEVITRVTEYVPEIVAYIEKIIANGYAYESNGSVYFAVDKFSENPLHTYAKLEPTSVQDKEKMAESEGVLTDINATGTEKRYESDFALWKKAKEGEPFWESPWGQGRPGWHIECSAMASSIFKANTIDIHTGGSDLRFPHHDNELAQSEAYYSHDGWINHFWHTGPLKIAGLKMSKSLKNFITIKAMLKSYNPRVLRYLFLIHNWNSPMQFDKDKSFAESVVIDKKFTEFFRTYKSVMREVEIKSSRQAWTEKDEKMSAALLLAKSQVHEALCDSFDTPTAVQKLSDLVSAANTYISGPANEIKVPLMKNVSGYILKMLKCFGVFPDEDTPNLAQGAEEGQAVDVEAQIAPLMNALRDYRDKMKTHAGEDKSVLFKLADELRDDILPHLNIKLEDKGKNASVWKFVDKETIFAERKAKLEADQAKAEAKAAEAALKLKKQSTPPEKWFPTFFADEYEEFDEQGIPTVQVKPDKKGSKEVNTNIRNKLVKQWNTQKATYEKWLATQQPKEEEKVEQVAVEEEKKE